MPKISEIMDDTVQSEETSLQVSSTSPDVVPNVGRALHVRRESSQASHSSSSSSQQSALPTVPHQSSQLGVRNKTRKSSDGPYSSRSSSLHSTSQRPPKPESHRGQGSIVPVGSVSVSPHAQSSEGVDSHMENILDAVSFSATQHNLYDQRSHADVHVTQQNLYDQRSMHVQIGVDPAQVIQHVQSAESQAQPVIRDAVAHVQQTQHQAESVVQETHRQAQKVYHDASDAVHQARYHDVSCGKC